MDHTEIQDNITNGVYTNKVPYATRRSNQYQHTAYQIKEQKLQKLFQEHTKQYIISELGGVTDTQFGVMFSKAWDDGHAYGYQEVLNKVSELIDFIKYFKNMDIK